jgi:Cdc6-like AAA superfamily ATPase
MNLRSHLLQEADKMTNMHHLESLQTQLKIVTDRVRGVATSLFTGMYLYGRAGTGKTYTVRSSLDKMAVSYTYNSGHLTPLGLFELIDCNRDKVIVLDDVSAIFHQPISLQILLAALGNPHNETGFREVHYKTARGETRILFRGGIIAVSNLSIQGRNNKVLQALGDRVFTINYEPSDEQIIALMRHIASNGIRGFSSSECLEVCDFLVEACQVRTIRPSVRLFVDKSMRDYELFKTKRAETHWHDLVCSNLEQQLVVLTQPTNDLSRSEKLEAERRIVLDLISTFDSKNERITHWTKRTGKSRAAYYRRVKELRQTGKLPND